MKSAGLKEIKDELQHFSNEELLALCLRLARFKKENKELLAYLLFGASNLEGFLTSVKAEVEIEFKSISTNNDYLARKSLRRIEKMLNRYCKYVAIKAIEAELFIFFLEQIRKMPVWKPSKTWANHITERLVGKIEKAIVLLNPDLQYDLKAILNRVLV